MKQEHCNIPSMLYSRCSSRALGNLLHQCTSAATWAAYQYLWVVFKQNFTNSEKSELVSLACIQLDEGEWGNLTEVKWFAWPLRVNVAYGTSCRQAHCHSASSNSSLGHPYITSTQKVCLRESSCKGKKQNTWVLEFNRSTTVLRMNSSTGMGWWLTIVGVSPQVKMLQQHSPSLHHMQTLQCDTLHYWSEVCYACIAHSFSLAQTTFISYNIH